MKKRILKVVVTFALTCSLLSAASCMESNNDIAYTIQYTDQTGIHTLTVPWGKLYSLETLPEKHGYEFLGLFDKKIGGTQYIDETGISLSAFKDTENLVLYPQFKPIEYTLILDYQGAPVTSTRSLSVSYDSKITELPTNVTMEHHQFVGWFTAPNGKGTQICDQYGVLPTNNTVTEKTFDLSQEDKHINLYAAFESVNYTVTFHFEDNTPSETVAVPYGTDIKNVIHNTRINEQGVLTWSTTANDIDKQNVFTGKITHDIDLYAIEYAPVIDFEENGGEDVVPVVAYAGSAITLPNPHKENYKFIEWQDEFGNSYTSTIMPEESITLKAVWQAELVFDENGGTEVTDISKAVDESIALPIPEKEGYIFAGWYTAEKEKYESTTMPSRGIALKAGWYKEKVASEVIIDATESQRGWWASIPDTDELCFSLDFDKYFDTKEEVFVVIDWKVSLTADYSGTSTATVGIYRQKQISSAYYMYSTTFNNVTDEYKRFSFNTSFNISDDIYIVWDIDSKTHLYLSNFYYTIYYPDTSILYL